jgi:hypothetical protein
VSQSADENPRISCCSKGVEQTREYSFHLHHSVVIGWPHAPKPGFGISMYIGAADNKFRGIQALLSKKCGKIGIGRQLVKLE